MLIRPPEARAVCCSRHLLSGTASLLALNARRNAAKHITTCCAIAPLLGSFRKGLTSTVFASYFRRARYARPGHCELYQQTAVASQTVARESRTEAAWLLCDRQRAPTAGQEAPPRPHEGQPKLRTSAPHWRLRAGRGARLRPRPDAAPPKNGENNGRGRPICGLPLDHRRSKSDCDWTPVEDEGDHTPSTDLNSASPFPQSPVLNTWVSSCSNCGMWQQSWDNQAC